MNFPVLPSADQILALAPDPAVAGAGKKIATAKTWTGVGRSDAALWGQCQGTALYQVRVDLADLLAKCTCPSRKFPCKHAIGLLLLAAATPGAVPEAEPPEWVTSWMAKRAEGSKRKERKRSSDAKPVDAAAQAKRANLRLERVREGIDGLDLWMNDLIRNGLAAVETQGLAFWEKQAARMVDAQAPGIAARLRAIASIVGASPDWPDRLLDELGRLALLTRALRRIEDLPLPLQDDLRALAGWTMEQADVVAGQDLAFDDWVVVGQLMEDEGRIRVQRTWMIGSASKRPALMLQFSAGGGAMPTLFLPGTRFQGELAYWPSAWPLRALLNERKGPNEPVTALPVSPSIEGFLEEACGALARLPWLDRLPCSLGHVVPIRRGELDWIVVDHTGAALPLTPREHWTLLALSGGHPVEIAGEWNGSRLLPLAAVVEATFHALEGARQ